ncbi:MAG TPA: sensor histidine kinase [Chitinophagaceae bacterium]|jgi:signal transduction histidine kinase
MPQKEYEIITGLIVVVFILLLAGAFIISLVSFNNRRKKKHIDEKLAMQSNFQQELLRTQLEIQEQTLKNISQEIHDNIGQVLSLAKFNLGTIDISQIDKLQQKIDDSKNLVGKSIQDLRDLAKSLDTDYVVQMGLARSIEYELEMIKKTEAFETTFEINGSPYKFDQQTELIVFRIVQETLNNIIKHSKASRILVDLKYDLNNFRISVSDNGQGFPVDKSRENEKPAGGLGIKNMQNRAKLIGAEFNILSKPGEGTLVEISLPIK